MNFNVIDKVRLTTPVCKFLYPKLIEPETRFNPEGTYKLNAVIPAAEADEVSGALEELMTRHKASLKAQAPSDFKFKLAEPSYLFEEVDGAPCFVMKVKQNASGVDRSTGKRWTAAPALFDSRGALIKDRESLRSMWSGTMGRVSFDACPFYVSAVGAGITLRLKAVQIIDLVEGGGSAESFGFGEEEGWTTGGNETGVPFDSSASIIDEPSDF